jgi:hypothetical protein
MNINNLAQDIYKQNVQVGWWDDPNRCLYQTLQLVSTEIAEATEGERKNLMDDHLPHRKMGEVELADSLIRVLDIGGYLKLTYNPLEQPHRWCLEEQDSIGKQHLAINATIISFAYALEEFLNAKTHYTHELLLTTYSIMISSILHVADRNSYDIKAATHEKHAYNKTRADHKRENREKEHGKMF